MREIAPLPSEEFDFIVRLFGDRHLLHWNGKRLAAALAGDCEMKYRQRVAFKSHGKELEVPIEYGTLPVRLPDHPGVELRLVVVKWPGGASPAILQFGDSPEISFPLFSPMGWGIMFPSCPQKGEAYRFPA